LWIETKIVVGDSFFFSCLSHPASSGAGITLIKTLFLLLGVGEAEKKQSANTVVERGNHSLQEIGLNMR